MTLPKKLENCLSYMLYAPQYVCDRAVYHISPKWYYKMHRSLAYSYLKMVPIELNTGFMSAPYKPLDSKDEAGLSLVLEHATWPDEDKPHLCLYEKPLTFIQGYPKLNNLDFLEVGCGQARGLRWVHCAHPELRSVQGLDLVVHDTFDHRVVRGDAHSLPYDNQSIDIVHNVESACEYDDKPKFFGEVFRVLRPGGYFTYTDAVHNGTPAYLSYKSMDELSKYLTDAGFNKVALIDITQNVGVNYTYLDF